MALPDELPEDGEQRAEVPQLHHALVLEARDEGLGRKNLEVIYKLKSDRLHSLILLLG